MKFLFDRDTWQEIFGSIRKNKLRTVITVIGVLWGIFVYIALSGAAKGMDNGFEDNFKDIAANSMFVWAQRTSIPFAGFKTGRPLELKIGDVEVLKRKHPQIQYIAPRNVEGAFGGTPPRVVNGLKTGSYKMFGDFPIIDKISRKKIFAGGRFINQKDIDLQRKVVVIGERIRQEMFDSDIDPIGKYLEINGVYYKVVGIYESDRGGFEGDDSMFVPFTTFRTLFNRGDEVNWFAIAGYDDVDIVKLEKEVKRTLRRVHQVHPDDERAFGSFNFGEVFGRIMGFARGLNLLSLIVGIATILAGVIAIGNVLLISVKERTKEIGIRRALGATPAEVRRQILLEAVFLTLVAGIIGIGLGALVLAGINAGTQNIDFPFRNPTVPVAYVSSAVLIMIGLGTLIGLIPAQRAISIKPIDALREE